MRKKLWWGAAECNGPPIQKDWKVYFFCGPVNTLTDDKALALVNTIFSAAGINAPTDFIPGPLEHIWT